MTAPNREIPPDLQSALDELAQGRSPRHPMSITICNKDDLPLLILDIVEDRGSEIWQPEGLLRVTIAFPVGMFEARVDASLIPHLIRFLERWQGILTARNGR